MKRLVTFLLLLSPFFLSSCIFVDDVEPVPYPDGFDGRYYIQLVDQTCVESWWDNNPCTPIHGDWNVYYGPCQSTGTFNFEYFLCHPINGWEGWEGTYTVYVNPGERGNYDRPGRDGRDLHFDLSLFSDGLDTYVYKHGGTVAEMDTTLNVEGGYIHLKGKAFRTGEKTPKDDAWVQKETH